MNRAWRDHLLPWCLPCLLLLGWFAATEHGAAPDWLLPPPRQVARTLAVYVLGVGDDPQAGRFWPDAAASLGRVAAGQLAPYPPGIPVVAPGERIGKKELSYFAQIGYNSPNVAVVKE